MPVSKKRKKAGKPVQRSASPAETTTEHPHGPDAKAAVKPGGSAGKPSNPFVAQQQGRRGALRGR